MRGTYRFLFSLIFIITGVVAAYCDARDKAYELELEGNTAGAIKGYVSWLTSNPNHPDVPSVIEHAAELHGKSLDVLIFIETYIHYAADADQPSLYARMAGLESLLGLPGDAVRHYELAASAGGPQGLRWLLDSAALCFGMGEFEKARNTALKVLDRSTSTAVEDEAAALGYLALAMEGRPAEALGQLRDYIITHSSNSSPLLWLAQREIALATGDVHFVGEAENRLATDFSGSVVHYLTESRVFEWISPATFLRDLRTIPGVPLQTGAFRSRQGASSLRSRLEADGFTAWIESSEGYWRVFVNDPEGDTASKLAALGYSVSVRR